MSLNVPGRQIANPELEEFKAQVVETARRYAKKHNLCGVVDDALDEMGVVSDVDNTLVTSKVVVEFELASLVDQNKFAGMNEAEELALAAKVLADSFTVRGSGGAAVKSPTIRVRSIERRASDTPEFDRLGLVRKFVGHDGRVSHLFKSDAPFSSVEVAHRHALCGSNIGWYTYMENLVDHSPRDTGGICKKCEAKASTLASV